MPKKVITKEITNFSGRLTRYESGDLNSGFAKFDTSWGYDPFSKPGDLTWLYQPSDIKDSVITDVVMAAESASPASTLQAVYAIGNTSRLYQILPTMANQGSFPTPLLDTPSLIGAVGSVSGTFAYGADIDYYNGKLSISSDSTITTANLDGSAIASVTGSAGSVVANVYHPFIQFQGKQYYGNGNNIGEINGGVFVTGSKLSPALPMGMSVVDLDVTPDGTYMIITASYQTPYRIGLLTDNILSLGKQPFDAVDAYTFYWNGTDTGVTSYQTLPAFPTSALSTFMDKRYFFNQDSFGMGLWEGNVKLMSLPNTITPMPNGETPNGEYLTWVSPEGIGAVSQADRSYDSTATSLYYFGKLDAENPAGLWRLLRVAPTTPATERTYRAPMNMMVNSFGATLNLVVGWGKHYFSVWDFDSTGGTSTPHFYRFVLPPAADTSPTLGVYETQSQLFSKKVGIKQIRVYTEPTATGNGFQLDIIGGDNNVVSDGTFTYTFAAGSDETKLQGALERINFNPKIKTLYSLGIRITNTGTTNMTIKKIEVDYAEEGK